MRLGRPLLPLQVRLAARHATRTQQPGPLRLRLDHRQPRGHRDRQCLQLVASYSGGPGGKDDKSWGDIAEEAATLAKDVAGKVAGGVSSLVGQLLPGQGKGKGEVQGAAQARVVDTKAEAGRELYSRGRELGRELFGGGLLGRAAGGLMGAALRSVGQSLAEASQQLAEVQARAASAIESDPRVRSALGGSCRAGQPMQQSSMSSSVNGVSRRRVTLVLPVEGPGGRMAQAQCRRAG